MYEWDRAKDAANRLKHGIGFDRAEDFDWPGAMIEEDERFDYGERRFRAFGYLDDRPFCVVFAPRGENVRIISMRLMHQKEARRYGLNQA